MSSYKILATADIHMSNRLPYARPGERDVTDRLNDQLYLIDDMLKKANKAKVDAIFILGDLFDHSKVDAITLTHTIHALSETEIDIYIMAGNHDATSVHGGRYVVEAFGEMGNDRIHYLDSEIMPTRWLQFLPMPYVSISEAKEQLEEAKRYIIPEAMNVLLFHHSVLGCDHLEWTCDDGLDPDELCDGFDLVIGGHFHNRQTFGPDGIGMYTGAPMHHDFGDRGRDAGYWLIEMCEKELGHYTHRKKFIHSKTPRFHVVKEKGGHGIRRLKPSDDWKSGDYVRIEIEATHANWVKNRVAAKEYCESIEKSHGVRASYKHKPIYQHKKRLEGDAGQKEASKHITLESSVMEYVESATVETGGMDKDRLKELGKQALEAVRSEHGFV